MIAADGRSVSAVFDFPATVWSGHGAWVQGAFTIVFQEFAATTSVKALRVDGAGRVLSTTELFAGDFVGLVSAVAGADDLRVIFQDQMPTAPYNGIPFLQRFTATGEPLTERKMISSSDVTFGGGAQVVARGADTVLFADGGPLRYGRLTADGDLQPAAHAIAQAPYGIISIRGHQPRFRYRRRVDDGQSGVGAVRRGIDRRAHRHGTFRPLIVQVA